MELDFSKPFKFKEISSDIIFTATPKITGIDVAWPHCGNPQLYSYTRVEKYIQNNYWQIIPEASSQSEAMLSLEDYIKAIHRDNKEICDEVPLVTLDMLEEFTQLTGVNVFIVNGSYEIYYDTENPLSVYNQYDLKEAMKAIVTLIDLEGN